MKPEEILALAKAVQSAEEKAARASVARGTVLPVDFTVRVRGTVKVGEDTFVKVRNGGIDPWQVMASLISRFVVPSSLPVETMVKILTEPDAKPWAKDCLEKARKIVEETFPVEVSPRSGSVRAQIVFEGKGGA